MSESPAQTYSMDPTLYIYTSLTAGSSQIVTATSRLETILRANRIPYKAIDLATDEKARMLWGRRAGKDESGRQRKIPALVQEGLVVGDLVEIEDWNEYGELKQHVRIVGQSTTPARPAGFRGPGESPALPATPTATPTAAPTAPPLPATKKESTPATPAPKPVPKETEAAKPPTTTGSSITLAMRQMGEEAAQKAKDMKKKPLKGKTEVFAGSGKAETTVKDVKGSTTPELSSSVPQSVESDTTLQDPETTAWSSAPGHTSNVSHHALNELKSLQSPTSTAWKAADIKPAISESGESDASTSSSEESKSAETKRIIPKVEDEEDDEDESESESDDDDAEDEDEDDEEDDDEDEEEDDDDDDDDEDEDEDESDEKEKPKKA